MDLFKKKKNKDPKEKKEKKDKKDKGTAQQGTEEEIKNYYNLLVIDSDDKDWYSFFKGIRCSNGYGIRVDKTRWENMMITSNGGKPQVYLKPNQSPFPGSGEGSSRQCSPDFVLIRKLVRGLCSDEDYRNILFGLMYSNIPTINTAHSVYMNLDRPVVHAALNELKRKHGDKFPLISQSYYSHQTTMLFTPDFPIVVKVGHAEAGYGKMKFESQDDFKDFRGVLALHKDYATIESFVASREYDLRIQKIGTNYRAYKRISANWKGNVGSSVIEEIPMTEEFTFWVVESGKLFGGMEILTVDAIYAQGKHYIIEINDTASGLYGPNEKEDMGYIRDLVVKKMNQFYTEEPASSPATSPSPSSSSPVVEKITNSESGTSSPVIPASSPK